MIRWISSLWVRLGQAFRGRRGETIDPEMRDVFLSELDEVSATLAALLPAWRRQRTQAATLQEIRRGFHTLKGSGLAVGANELGAFCGKLEKLTLDLIERPRQAAPGSIDSIERGIGWLPACAQALRSGAPMPPAVKAFARSLAGE
jgi:chemosensory pili system protein ChpA (sensor histidine kinase/response regulator)